MHHCKTNRLFYKKYLFKLSVHNELAPIFRGKNYTYTRKILDTLRHDYNSGKPLGLRRYLRVAHIRHAHYIDARIMFFYLQRMSDYLIRCEGSTFNIYSNNQSDLIKITKRVKNVIEYWEPESNTIDDILQGKILSNVKGYKYKVTFGDRVQNLGTWIGNNQDKVKVGPICLEGLQNDNYVAGLYIYVRDEKTLTLIKLLTGTGIRRIEEIISN